MRWKGKLLNNIIEQLKDDGQWEHIVEKMLTDFSIGIHLAIFSEPFLSLIYNREKKIESRFSINNISPYGRVKRGDIVVIKESGGLVTGIFITGEVIFYRISSRNKLSKIEEKYSNAICAFHDQDFWKKRVKSKFVSMIEVGKIKKLTPFKTDKNDRTAWVVLRQGIDNDLFNLLRENTLSN